MRINCDMMLFSLILMYVSKTLWIHQQQRSQNIMNEIMSDASVYA